VARFRQGSTGRTRTGRLRPGRVGTGLSVALMVLLIAALTTVAQRRTDSETDRDLDAAAPVGQGPSTRASQRSPDKEQLLQAVRPSTDCPVTPAGVPKPDEVQLDVLRVEGSCLVAELVAVPRVELEARLKRLRELPDVVGASTAIVPQLLGEAGRSLRDEQWALDALGASPRHAPSWPAARGVRLAIIDTGVDATHPDLAGAVTARYPLPEGIPLDPDGHGTHVAGIAGSRSNNGGLMGIAPEVQIFDVPVQIGRRNEGEPENPDLVDRRRPSLAQEIVWAVNQGASVINMSLGVSVRSLLDEENEEGDLDYLQALNAGVAMAIEADVVLIAASGNCGARNCDANGREVVPGQGEQYVLFVPAALDGVIAVAAVDQDLKRASYSSQGSWVDIAAPGDAVLSTWPAAKPCDSKDSTGIAEYCLLSGTSMAAPHIAAIVAALRSAPPTLSRDDVEEALLVTALDLEPAGRDEFYGAGFVQPMDALAMLADRGYAWPTTFEVDIGRVGAWRLGMTEADALAAWPGAWAELSGPQCTLLSIADLPGVTGLVDPDEARLIHISVSDEAIGRLRLPYELEFGIGMDIARQRVTGAIDTRPPQEFGPTDPHEFLIADLPADLATMSISSRIGGAPDYSYGPALGRVATAERLLLESGPLCFH